MHRTRSIRACAGCAAEKCTSPPWADGCEDGALAGDGDAAARFDGAGQWISAGDLFDLDGSTSYTLDVWVKPITLLPTYRGIVGKEETVEGLNHGYNLAVGDSGFTFNRSDADVFEDVDGPPPMTNVWTHVVGTFDGVALTLYINAVEVGATPSSIQLTDRSEPLAVAGVDGQFSGVLDEVEIFDAPLSLACIEAHFGAATQP